MGYGGQEGVLGAEGKVVAVNCESRNCESRNSLVGQSNYD